MHATVEHTTAVTHSGTGGFLIKTNQPIAVNGFDFVGTSLTGFFNNGSNAPYIDTRDKEHPPEFIAPGNIVFMSVDKTNGAPDEAGGITEAFISGTQPGTNFAH